VLRGCTLRAGTGEGQGAGEGLWLPASHNLAVLAVRMYSGSRDRGKGRGGTQATWLPASTQPGGSSITDASWEPGQGTDRGEEGQEMESAYLHPHNLAVWMYSGRGKGRDRGRRREEEMGSSGYLLTLRGGFFRAGYFVLMHLNDLEWRSIEAANDWAVWM
jgi:hypothetical protein